jgi:hypothetical protein
MAMAMAYSEASGNQTVTGLRIKMTPESFQKV